MIDRLSKKLAISEKGVWDFLKGTALTILFNLALMLPAVYAFIFLENHLLPILNGTDVVSKGFWFYCLLGIGFLCVTFLIAVFQYRSTYTTVYEESANRRLSLAEKLRKLPLAFFGEKNLSDLTSTIMADNTEMEYIFSHAVPQLFASIISVVMVVAGLFFYEWRLALALFWVLPFATAVVLVSKRFQSSKHKIIYNKKRHTTDHIQEGLETIQEIKAYSNESGYMEELEGRLKGYESELIDGELMIGVLVNSAQGFLKLGLLSVIIVGANLLAEGTIHIFTYLMFLIVASRIFEPVNQVFDHLAALFYVDVRIKRMNEMEALPIQKGKADFSPDSYNLVFDSVDFSYDTGKKVLKDLSFIAKQGEITALVGPSGGGKSTAAKLAARFWDVDRGKIVLGDQDISEVDPETLLKNYSVVFQDVVLFNTSIMDNIRIGNLQASDEEVLKVAKLAQCEDFVSRMPDAYKTIIGENGETLSGGERQRISIARALLKDAPIVLMDEATASLDVENETKIQAGISELIRNKTVLIIAHRMRTVANADKVVVIKDGTVIESGKPEDLKIRDGVFADMVRRQMGKGDLSEQDISKRKEAG